MKKKEVAGVGIGGAMYKVQPLICTQKTGYESINIYALSIGKDISQNGSISVGRETITGEQTSPFTFSILTVGCLVTHWCLWRLINEPSKIKYK